jgi:hypothetical protein
MYLEIIHNIVGEILADEKQAKSPITIQLTPTIYNAFQTEINKVICFITETPIEGFTAESIVMYKRTITIKPGTELDSRIEKKIVEELAKKAKSSDNDI